MSEIGPSASETGNAPAPIPTESADTSLPSGFATRESGLIAPASPKPSPEIASPATDPVDITKTPHLTEESDTTDPVHSEEATDPITPHPAEEIGEAPLATVTTLPTAETTDIKPVTVESAAKTADRLLNTKVATAGTLEGILQPAEQNLRDIHTFRTGFPPSEYAAGNKGVPGRIDFIDGLPVTQDDGSEITVLALKKDDIIDGERVYAAYVEGQTEPVQVKAEAIVQAHMKQHAESIASNFPEGPQRDLVTWHAKGGEKADLPSEDTIKSVEAELDAGPFKKADTAIAEQIVLLEAGLAAEDLPNEERRVKQAILNGLKIAEITVGNIGNLYKMNVLKCAQNASGSLIAQDIQTVLNDLEPYKDETQNKVDALLESSGASKDKIEEWKKLSRDPDGLPRLLSNPEFISLPDMTVAIFGKELTGADKANVDKMIDDLALTNLNKEQRTAWEIAKKTGVGASWILAILLAIPAGVAYGMVTTGLSSAGGRR